MGLNGKRADLEKLGKYASVVEMEGLLDKPTKMIYTVTKMMDGYGTIHKDERTRLKTWEKVEAKLKNNSIG